MKFSREYLNNVCRQINGTEERAKKAERESIKFKQAQFLSNKIGEVYDGIISYITNHGIFVYIPENGCEGYIDMHELFKNDMISSGNKFYLENPDDGEIEKQLGDSIKVSIKSVDILNKEINLSICN